MPVANDLLNKCMIIGNIAEGYPRRILSALGALFESISLTIFATKDSVTEENFKSSRWSFLWTSFANLCYKS